MKKYFVPAGIFMTVACWSQSSYQTASVESKLETQPFTPSHSEVVLLEERAAGDVIWSHDFTNASQWTAAGPSSNYAINGWSIGTAVNGWYFGPGGGGMGTTGNFARFVNGDPTMGGSVINNGPFTLTYNGVIDLSTVLNPQLEFEQYGARFITLQAIEVSTNGGLSWTQVGSNDDITPFTNTSGDIYPQPQTRSFNISTAIAPNPANVKIRLLWDGQMNGPSMNYTEYGWYVDNVRIVEGANFDAQIQEVYFRSGVGGFFPEGLTYYLVPENQVTPINFSGKAYNNGASTYTGLYLETEVEIGGAVTTSNSPTTNLLSFEEDSFAVSGAYTPAAGLGTYTITWTYEGSIPDEVPSNNVLIDQFQVTASTYGCDNGVAQGSIAAISGNPEGGFQIGNVMEIFADGYINSLSIRIGDDAVNEGQLVFGSLYIFDSGSSEFVYLGITDDYMIQNTDLDNFIEIDFPFPVNVYTGDILLVTAGHYGGTQPVSFSTAQPATEGNVLGLTDGSLFSLLSPNVIMIRADITGLVTNDHIEICDGQSHAVGSSVYTSTGVYTDTLISTLGEDSIVVTHLTVTLPYNITQNVSICDGEELEVGTSVYTTAGSYTDNLFTQNAGCDSTVHTNLTIVPALDLTVTQTGNTLTAQMTGVDYQWVDCNNGNAPLAGETDQTFAPVLNGSYGVRIDNGSCSDVSACFIFTDLVVVGLNENEQTYFTVYPNPSKGSFTVSLQDASVTNYAIHVTDNIGQRIFSFVDLNMQQYQVEKMDLAAGIYFIELVSEQGNHAVKLIIE